MSWLFERPAALDGVLDVLGLVAPVASVVADGREGALVPDQRALAGEAGGAEEMADVADVALVGEDVGVAVGLEESVGLGEPLLVEVVVEPGVAANGVPGVVAAVLGAKRGVCDAVGRVADQRVDRAGGHAAHHRDAVTDEDAVSRQRGRRGGGWSGVHQDASPQSAAAARSLMVMTNSPRSSSAAMAGCRNVRLIASVNIPARCGVVNDQTTWGASGWRAA